MGRQKLGRYPAKLSSFFYVVVTSFVERKPLLTNSKQQHQNNTMKTKSYQTKVYKIVDIRKVYLSLFILPIFKCKYRFFKKILCSVEERVTYRKCVRYGGCGHDFFVFEGAESFNTKKSCQVQKLLDIL